jgi:hypothetical protein
MTLIRILNGSRQVTNFPDGLAVWCDRRSALGNPFELRGESSRIDVCDAYGIYFDEVVNRWASPTDVAHEMVSSGRWFVSFAKSWRRPIRGEFMAELARLESLAKDGPLGLGCWCHPKRCHCDTIAAYLMGKLGVVDENAVTQGSLF